MKKTILPIAFLALFALGSCNKIDSFSSNPKVSSSEPTTNSSTSSSQQQVTPPYFEDSDFSYLLGNYYAKGSSVTITPDYLTIQGKDTLKLIPTDVRETTLNYSSDEKKSYKTLNIDFSGKFNDGVDYKAYINFEDGLLHIENLSTNSSIGTYMPDIQGFSGTYSAFGDGSEYNMYMSFDGHFDIERGVFPSNHRMMTNFGGEQSWYLKSFYTLLDDTPYIGIEEYDEDDYGYGKSLVIKDTAKKRISLLDGVDSLENYANYVTDIGGFHGLKLFDGTKSFTTSLDSDKKTFTFDGVTENYEVVLDETGYHLAMMLNGKKTLFSIGEYQLSTTAMDDEVSYYPIDDISALNGEFKYGDETFKISFDEENNVSVTVDSTKIDNVSYSIHNKRKSLQFQKDGKTYIISSDKANSSIRVEKDGSVFYPINEKLYSSYFTNTFIHQNEKERFVLFINEDKTYQIKKEAGKAQFSYHHGDKYPSLSLKYENKDCSLVLVQPEIGYFKLESETKSFSLYTQTVLDKVFGDYSSNGISDFKFDENCLTKDSKKFTYSFTPYREPKLGTYSFAITLDENKILYKNNLHGTFFNDNESYIRKDLFEDLYGTYSGYGKYGIENIKFTSEGKLYLDSLNSDKTGLVKDVEYTYFIMTNLSDQIALYFNYSEDLKIMISFKENAVEITGMTYYRAELLNRFGTFTDDENTLCLQDDKLYLNGKSLTTLEEEIKKDRIIIKTSDYTFTFYKDGDNVTMDSKTETRKLSRKFTFEDYKKFYGSFTINGSKIEFKVSESLGNSLTIDGVSYSYYISKHKEKYALTFSLFSTTYYVMLDETTNELSTDYESSIPLPPLPPAL